MIIDGLYLPLTEFIIIAQITTIFLLHLVNKTLQEQKEAYDAIGKDQENNSSSMRNN